MRREFETAPLGWEDAVRYNTLRLLLMLRRDWQTPRAGRSERPAPPNDLMRLLPALTALHAGAGDRLTMDRAAAACSLSTSRFSVLFRRALGLSFGQFSLRTRVSQAAQRLLQEDATIEDIATQFGFVDGSHLHRVFVKHFGATPAEYRRRFK